MTSASTGANSRATAEWITDHVSAGRRYKPLPGAGSGANSSAECARRWLAAILY